MRSLEQLHSDRLSAYLTAIDDLEHEGDQLHRRIRAQLYDFTTEHPAQHMLRWKDITDGIEQALDELAHVPTPSKASPSSTPSQLLLALLEEALNELACVHRPRHRARARVTADPVRRH